MSKVFLVIFAIIGLSLTALGQTPGGIDVPVVDPLLALIELVKNWRAAGPVAAGMTLVTILVQVLKMFPDFKYNRIAVTVLSVAYAGFFHVAAGLSIVNALVMALITGGGAIAIYEAFKGLSKALGTDKKAV
jgi:hypothetical protein